MKKFKVNKPVKYQEITSQVKNKEGYIVGFAKGVYAEDDDIEFKTMNLFCEPPFGEVLIIVGRMSGSGEPKVFTIDLSSHSYENTTQERLYLVHGKPIKRKPKFSYE